jgi:hypothetical protein
MAMMAVRNGGEQDVNKYYYGSQSLFSSAPNNSRSLTNCADYFHSYLPFYQALPHQVLQPNLTAYPHANVSLDNRCRIE